MEEYDVFLSVKNLDDAGRPTRDLALAQEIHSHLEKRGLRVFLSTVSLERLGASEYKRVIDNTLDVSAVLIAVGTSVENLQSRWVEWEWESFHNDMLSGRKQSKALFSYVEGVDTHNLPRTLRNSQVFVHERDPLEKVTSFVTNALGKTARERDDRIAADLRAEKERLAAEEAKRQEAAERTRAEEEARQASLAQIARLESEAEQARLRVEELERQTSTAREELRAFLETHLQGLSEEEIEGLKSALLSVTDGAESQAQERTVALARDAHKLLSENPTSYRELSFILSEMVGELDPEVEEALGLFKPSTKGLASTAHPHADPDGAARRNIEYRKSLAQWNALPAFKRWRTPKPPPPPGVIA